MNISRLIDPLKPQSLTDEVAFKIEELILSGILKIGDKLPSERELAQQFGVSRPVIHKALSELAFKGLLVLKPRVGAVVNDYRRGGSLSILNSISRQKSIALDPKLMESMIAMRKLFEVESARLAAMNRSETHLEDLRVILSKERNIQDDQIALLAEADFEFHHMIAYMSENMIHPLILNSFRSFYLNAVSAFYRIAGVRPFVLEHHALLIDAIDEKDVFIAMDVMKKLLDHGEKTLRKHLSTPMKGKGETP